eukprot:SAG22_NODE_3394_length_1735_cov_1.137531_2_plen_94_part_00
MPPVLLRACACAFAASAAAPSASTGAPGACAPDEIDSIAACITSGCAHTAACEAAGRLDCLAEGAQTATQYLAGLCRALAGVTRPGVEPYDFG